MADTPDFANMTGMGFGGFGGFGAGVDPSKMQAAVEQMKADTAAADAEHQKQVNARGLGKLDISKLKTTTTDNGTDQDGSPISSTTYTDANGNPVSVSVDTSGEDNSNPATSYSAKTNIDGRPVTATYDAQGNFMGASGDQITYQGHKYAPVYGANGALTYQPIQESHGFFADMLSALGPIAPLAIGLIAPELLPALGSFAAPALSAGVGLLAGQDPLKALEGAGLSYIGGNIAGGVSSGLTDTLGSTGANLAGRALSSEIMSGGKTDLGKLLTNAAISGGIGQLTNTGPSASDMTEGYFAPGGEGYIAPEEPTAPVTVPTQAEQQPAVDDFIKQIEQYQAPEPTVEQIMASEPPPAVAPAAPVEEPTDTVQALLDSQQPTPTNQAEIDQQTQDLLSSLSGGTDNGTSDNGTPANDQAEWDVPVAPSELQTALDNLPQEQAEWDVPVNPDDLNTALTEIAAPEPNDTPSPTEQDVLDFMKEHPDTSSGTAAKTAATKAAADKAASDKAAADKAAADKAAADKAAADKAAKDKAANDAFNQLKAQAQAQQNQQDALMRMMSSNNDVAHIKSDTNLFGAIPGMEPPASSAQQQPDPVAALQGMDQQYAIGGHVDDFDVDALLHILRS
jgi:hypothetical protein